MKLTIEFKQCSLVVEFEDDTPKAQEFLDERYDPDPYVTLANICHPPVTLILVHTK